MPNTKTENGGRGISQTPQIGPVIESRSVFGDRRQRYDLFLNDGSTSPYADEWRHVGEFDAQTQEQARYVAVGYLDSLRRNGVTCPLAARVFTASMVGRLITEVSR